MLVETVCLVVSLIAAITALVIGRFNVVKEDNAIQTLWDSEDTSFLQGVQIIAELRKLELPYVYGRSSRIE